VQVHIIAPYRIDKNLARAYNEAMQLIPDGDYACLHDIDVSFLTPDAGQILHNYALKFPKAGLLTCYTNRVSALSKMQLLKSVIDADLQYGHHVQLAEKQKQKLYCVTHISTDISGMLMLVSKAHWKEFPFVENGGCLGVDTAYGRMMHSAGKSILRMDGLYVFHGYRVLNGIHNKEHLK
jgi:hypothetical protein